MRLGIPRIDLFSLLFGLILASLFWWIVSMLRPALLNIRKQLLARKELAKKEKAHSPSLVEEHYRQSLLRYAQGLHLASPLFSLDEIIEPPTLLAPPPRVEPGIPLVYEDIVAATVPYMPAWPELGAIYHAPTLTLAEALSGNSDIVLTSQAGMGKTVALAHLASRLARRDAESGLPTETIPFLIHVADLDLPIKKDDPLISIIEVVADQAPVLDLPRIPDFVRKTYESGRALLLLDGTDELTPDGLKNAVEFIKAIKHSFPKTRMVTTASSEYLDGLVSLNFIPFAMAAWNSKQRMEYCQKWGILWERFVSVEAWAQSREQVDTLLLNSWLLSETGNLTPLEMTLKLWGVYAGDVRGSRPMDLLETHLRRLTPTNIPREAIEMLALQTNLSTEPIFDPRKAREWIRSFEPPEPVESSGSGDEPDGKNPDPLKTPSHGMITRMLESGLLIQHRNNRMCFIHPIFAGYLAGKALSNYKPEIILDQPPWIGKFLAMHYLAATGDATPLIDKLLAVNDRPLSRNLLLASRWLRDAPRQAGWRSQVMARLADLISQTGQPLGLRGQALSAVFLSEDPGASPLFRKFLEERDNELLQLAALGSGAMQDVKAIESLAGITNTTIPNVRRAGCLALTAIGTTAAMDVVGSALLHGDENLRRAAAEAMANHPAEGFAMLKEGALMKSDLLVRRSVAYGLGRISEPWAEELLAHMQTEDDQWAVRNAAVEAAENRHRTNPYIPQRLPPPAESPWIIAYAGKQGLGVSPDKPPIDLLLLALRSGSEEEQLAALDYLRMMPTQGVFGALYHSMYGGEPSLREAVFLIMTEMASRGVDVPDPVQFGVGY